MKKKALLKDTLREIRKSFGRFFSIFAIVGIGVAFFAGVRDSVPVMKNTADTYFDESKTVGPASLNVWTANNTYTTFEALGALYLLL